ncbi:MAG: transporter substrate-binding domain-containing protein [Deltaproteobacteria bacterium]
MSTQKPVKVGVLFSSTGPTATIETSQLEATLFAIDEINQAGGINGRELKPVHYDPCSDPIKFRFFAEKLILEDNVNVIFGCYLSNTRKAVLSIVEKWQRLLFYPTPYEGFEFSRNIIYTGPAPNQNSAQLAEFMSRNFGPRVYMVGNDYIYPHESNRIMRDFMLNRLGGANIAERYVAMDAHESDFRDIVRHIKDTQPDFIFSTVVGNCTKLLYEAYAEAGLNSAKMPIASLTTCESELSQMSQGIAKGHFTAAPYFQSVVSETNQKCIARFRLKFGTEVEPNMCWEAAYFQVHLFAQAMLKSDSDAIDQLLPSLLGSEFNAPQGKVRINPINHHTRLNPRIARISHADKFEIVQEITAGVDADPYLIKHELSVLPEVQRPLMVYDA